MFLTNKLIIDIIEQIEREETFKDCDSFMDECAIWNLRWKILRERINGLSVQKNYEKCIYKDCGYPSGCVGEVNCDYMKEEE